MAIKYDDIKVVLDYFQNDFFVIKFDLTSAYHFVDIYIHRTQKTWGFHGLINLVMYCITSLLFYHAVFRLLVTCLQSFIIH